MTLANLIHPIKAQSIDDSSHQIALDETLSISLKGSLKIHSVWPAHSQYALSAFIVSDFGHVEIVSADGYGAEKVSPSVISGTVKHTGEVTHGFPKRTEQIIEARFTDRIRMIVPVIHTKHFGKHGCVLDKNVKIRITNDNALDVSIDPTTKPNSNQIYSYSPCIIRNGPDGITIHSWEKYSAPSTYFAPFYDLERHQLRLDTKVI